MAKDLLFVVDDDPHIRGLLTALLEDKGYAILALESGEQCLEKIDESPSVIFMDMVMPGMGGEETLKKIKSWNLYSHSFLHF